MTRQLNSLVDKKVIRIAHRGNYQGKVCERENTPAYLLEAKSAGFDCEIDCWFVDGVAFLGHDIPQHQVGCDFLEQDGFWIHAKNLEAVDILSKTDLNWFWHNDDELTITSKGYLWVHSKSKYLAENSISCCFEPRTFRTLPYGICSDNFKYIAVDQ